ncbi:hypothetical protein KUCAC02_003695, partial [Chaenocephalus aceratus]
VVSRTFLSTCCGRGRTLVPIFRGEGFSILKDIVHVYAQIVQKCTTCNDVRGKAWTEGPCRV